MEKLTVGKELRNGASVIASKGGYVLALFNDEYVTWAIDPKGNTYWGHYFKDIVRAAEDLDARAAGE